jgi:hypothetical protein
MWGTIKLFYYQYFVVVGVALILLWLIFSMGRMYDFMLIDSIFLIAWGTPVAWLTLMMLNGRERYFWDTGILTVGIGFLLGVLGIIRYMRYRASGGFGWH